MKPRLSKNEYLELGRIIKSIIRQHGEIANIIFRSFPKNSRIVKTARSADMPFIKMYYQLETEFLRDYPDMEVTDYGK